MKSFDTTGENDDVISDGQNLSHSGLARDIPDRDLGSTEDGDWGADFSLFDACNLGGLASGDTLDFLDDEEGLDSPYSRFIELSASAENHLQKFKRRRRTKALSKITLDDFEEGAERDAFQIIDYFSNLLFSSSAKRNEIDAAIDYFFTIKDTGANLTFNLCCDVLGARTDILRLRIQYEWWLRNVQFTGPFPFLTVPVPSIITGEIAYYCGEPGSALARECWVQPGMARDELLACVEELDGYTQEKLSQALEQLEQRFLMSNQAGHYYVTGRNPLLLNLRAEHMHGQVARGGSFHWSKLFGKSV